jgi:hypothetical protein
MIRLQRSFQLSNLAHNQDVRTQQERASHTMNCHIFVQVPQCFQTLFVKSECRLKLVMYHNMFLAEYCLYLLVTLFLEFLL